MGVQGKPVSVRLTTYAAASRTVAQRSREGLCVCRRIRQLESDAHELGWLSQGRGRAIRKFIKCPVYNFPTPGDSLRINATSCELTSSGHPRLRVPS